MKKNIHPEYKLLEVECTCGTKFETRSTLAKGELKIGVCSNCHPFYTGRQRFAQAQGRVERFNKKYGLK